MSQRSVDVGGEDGLTRLAEALARGAAETIESGRQQAAASTESGGPREIVAKVELAPTAAKTQATSGEAVATASKQTAGSGLLGVVANLNPIVAGLMKLFSGGDEEQAATLVKLERPAARNYRGGISEQWGGAIGEVDYQADGTPRASRSEAAPVVVNVQAIDSRSFLDHRDAIASAVRQALLESHGLGDVMREV